MKSLFALLRCQGCDMSVHKICYGYKTYQNAQTFLCDECREGVEDGVKRNFLALLNNISLRNVTSAVFKKVASDLLRRTNGFIAFAVSPMEPSNIKALQPWK